MTRFSARNLPPIAFGDDYIRFGVEDVRLLKQSDCSFHRSSETAGGFDPAKKTWEEWLPERFPEDSNICFYIEFRL